MVLMPDFSRLIGLDSWWNLKAIQVKLYPQLYNALMLRNATADQTYEQLLTYAIGYVNRMFKHDEATVYKEGATD